MKRIVIKASKGAKMRNRRITASVDLSADPEFEVFFHEVAVYVANAARKAGVQAYATQMDVNKFGYPCVTFTIFERNEEAGEIVVCPWDSSTDEVLHNITTDIKMYIDDEFSQF